MVNNIQELAPVVYTPTVGQVCIEYSGNKFRRPRGMYFSKNDRGSFATMMYVNNVRMLCKCVER